MTVVLLAIYGVVSQPAGRLVGPKPSRTSIGLNSGSLSIAANDIFAGYLLPISTAAVGAQWNVPTISPVSQSGQASTWIGIENDSPTLQLVQTGVLEDKVNGDVTYRAFWTDTKLKYQPKLLSEVVDPMDHITVDISLIHSAWTISIRDSTSHWQYTTRPRGLVGQHFGDVAWTQEDPRVSLVAGASSTPYPKIALVTFDHLSVNGLQPHLPSSDALEMHLPGGVLIVPSEELSDAFSLRRIRK